MKDKQPSYAKRVQMFNAKLEDIYPNGNYSYHGLVRELGQGVVNEVVLPTVYLTSMMGIKEN